MIKAIRVHQPGGPEALQYEEIDLAPPGPGEVQIRHRAIGVNYIDIYRRSGAYPAELPFIPGHEGAGEVIAVVAVDRPKGTPWAEYLLVVATPERAE